MTISGSFKDLKNNTISVIIYKAGDLDTYSIDDYLDSTHHFCFDGKSPVTIKHKCSDLFEPIISTSCKIKLRANMWCGDILFSAGMGDIIVKVERTLEGSNTSDILFVGYVTPLTFSQNINKPDNIIDINCVDLITYFKDKYLSTGLISGQTNSAWSEALSQAEYRTFINIFKKIGLYDTPFVFPGSSLYTNLYIDNNGKNTMSNIFSLSDNLWLGGSMNEEMNMYDILLELLKYMNSRIVSTNGLVYYIIANDNSDSVSDFALYNHSEEGNVYRFPDDNILPTDDIANEQVTIDDCFNKIGVKCNMESVDDVIKNILDEENIYSDYNNKQKWFTEMGAPSKDLLWRMIRNGGLVNIPSGDPEEQAKCWVKDWYIRVMKSKYWNLNNNFESTDLPLQWDTTPHRTYPINDTDGNYINQQKAAYDLGIDRVGNTYTSTNRMGAYIVQYGSGNERTLANNKPDTNPSMTTALVIPVCGQWYDGRVWADTTPDPTQRANAEEAEMTLWSNYLERYNDDPMVSYDSDSSINLKPSDNNTINYIVISGSLVLQPVLTYAKKYNTVNGDVIGMSGNNSAERIGGSMSGQDLLVATTAVKKEDTPWYYHACYDKEYTNAGSLMRSTIPTMYTWRPFIEIEKLKDFQYTGQQNIVLDNMQQIDTIYKIPVLCCRLSVGDMYVNETFDSNGKSTYSWVDINDWSGENLPMFSIGIDPGIDDFIIGKKWDILSNVTPEMNLKDPGLAIPITYNDNINGKMHFEIVGPYNTMWEEQTHETHGWFSSWWNGWPRSSWTHTNYSLLNHISSIIIDKFEINIDTNNGKNATLNAGDLLYYSEDNYKYNNAKDDIDFKVVTALTAEEAASMNIASGISFNNPTLSNGDLYTSAFNTRPEVQYVTTMYNLYSTPKKIIEYKCNLDDNKIDEMYRSVYSCDLMDHLNVVPFSSIVISDELDLKNDRIKISLREL